ncbi:unnamed protein product [Diabrotica balteata]|uniref:Uncharacterized protein n=1 Tax=Diabrotica balteata TaxID=107213 RepID=A0A9N9TF41_DIABA|nr:unnamed protein product [Diabrotica balteata]
MLDNYKKKEEQRMDIVKMKMLRLSWTQPNSLENFAAADQFRELVLGAERGASENISESTTSTLRSIAEQAPSTSRATTEQTPSTSRATTEQTTSTSRASAEQTPSTSTAKPGPLPSYSGVVKVSHHVAPIAKKLFKNST